MSRYIIRRILIAIPVFFGITILAYFIISLIPGSPLDLLLQNPSMSIGELERKKREMGLDQPIIIQYFNWLAEMFKGNMGISYRTNRPVFNMIAERVGPTILLTFSSLIVAYVIGIPIGIIAAVKRYSWLDYSSTLLAFLAASTPNFFLGLVFIYIFSVNLEIFPIGGMFASGSEASIMDLLLHMIMPVIVLAAQQFGKIIRYTRSGILETYKEDYVRTARAKGLYERVVLLKHILKNALIPLVTLLGLSIPFLVGGAVITEQVFGWPGLGNLFVQSVHSRDYPTIMGVIIIIAIGVLVGNLIVDIIYGFLDPQISYD